MINMQKTIFNTTVKELLSDLYTPVGIYLRLRDTYRDAILLESADNSSENNSLSIIGVHAIAGLEVTNLQGGEYKLPGEPIKSFSLEDKNFPTLFNEFSAAFVPAENSESMAKLAQGLYGYCSYEGVQLLENIRFTERDDSAEIPLLRYRLYQYVIVINHFNQKMYICENHFAGVSSQRADIETKIKSKDVPSFPFQSKGELTSPITDDDYKAMVRRGIEACMAGEVFQVVVSRKYEQKFVGDDFNVYRALRSINPSPYLFYFDYGDYRIAGSSPESQVLVSDGVATMHPIAGTVLRTGDQEADLAATKLLIEDEKENAEHVMLVDLARNDLSRIGNKTTVTKEREVQYYSHVIHLVSEVQAHIKPGIKPIEIIAATFPAGTLSGAPKYRAMQIIDKAEKSSRGFYGGLVGFIGFDGSVNSAIMIRSYRSKNNSITLQAGAGVVAASTEEGELQEVNNKLGALQKAIESASKMTSI